MSYKWYGTHEIDSKDYICGHCGNDVASNVGYWKGTEENGSGIRRGFIYICHRCHKPTFFDVEGKQTPGTRFGEDVSGITNSGIENLYNEARDAYSKNAFTAAVLSCRKLLMHIAVDKGAAENLTFIQYVEYLADNGHITASAKGWVDHIRQKGNEANHEIVIMTEEEAKNLISFVEMLLKLIYEFPSRIPVSPTTQSNTTP